MAKEEYTNFPGEDEELFEDDGLGYMEDGEEAGSAEKPAEEPKRGFRVKYNGEDRDLTDEEARTYAQKGMNYDKLHERLTGLETDGAREALDVEKELADRYGMTRAEYRKYAREHLAKELHDEEMNRVKEESPGISDKLAEEIVNARIASKKKEAAEKAEQKEAEPWEELLGEYPDIKSFDDMPDDAKEAVRAGKSPLMSMKNSEIARLRKELADRDAAKAAEDRNRKNDERALGSMKNATGEDDEVGNILFSR